jgi:hypothetical protein
MKETIGRLTGRARLALSLCDESAVHELLGAPGYSDDRGGCVNLLTPKRIMIERPHAMAAGSRLIEVEEWSPAVNAAGARGRPKSGGRQAEGSE